MSNHLLVPETQLCGLDGPQQTTFHKRQDLEAIVQHFDSFSRLYTPTPPPIRRLPLDKSPNSAQVSLMAEKESLLRTFTPELDGEGKRVDSLLVAPDERASKVDAL